MPDKAKVEVLKVWYSVFCTIVDAHAEGEYTDKQLLVKIVQLRRKLTENVPEVEREMAKHKN